MRLVICHLLNHAGSMQVLENASAIAYVTFQANTGQFWQAA